MNIMQPKWIKASVAWIIKKNCPLGGDICLSVRQTQFHYDLDFERQNFYYKCVSKQQNNLLILSQREQVEYCWLFCIILLSTVQQSFVWKFAKLFQIGHWSLAVHTFIAHHFIESSKSCKILNFDLFTCCLFRCRVILTYIDAFSDLIFSFLDNPKHLSHWYRHTQTVYVQCSFQCPTSERMNI